MVNVDDDFELNFEGFKDDDESNIDEEDEENVFFFFFFFFIIKFRLNQTMGKINKFIR